MYLPWKTYFLKRVNIELAYDLVNVELAYDLVNLELAYDLVIPLLGFYPIEMKIYIHPKTCPQMF